MMKKDTVVFTECHGKGCRHNYIEGQYLISSRYDFDNDFIKAENFEEERKNVKKLILNNIYDDVMEAAREIAQAGLNSRYVVLTQSEYSRLLSEEINSARNDE